MDPRCLCKVTAVFNVDLHPSKLHDVRGGVQEHLNTLLMRYNEDFGGVVMCVGTFSVLSNQAPVNLYFPLFRVRVRAPLVVFKPQKGSLLTGRVIKVGSDFIGLLVLGVLNASIPMASVRPEFVCSKLPPLEWHSQKHRKHVIRVGSHVKFHVDKMQDPGSFFSIYGSLKAKGTGAIDYVGAGLLDKALAKEDGAKATGETPAKALKAAKAAKPSTPALGAPAAQVPAIAGKVPGTGGDKKKDKKDKKKDKKEKKDKQKDIAGLQ